MMPQRIIHISGTSASGKTTLGEHIQKVYKNKVVVVDTDSFIQHHLPEGKMLTKLLKHPKEYHKVWTNIIKHKVDAYISKYPNKVIIFVGLLNNWGINDIPYSLHIPCIKYFIDIPLSEVLKRYYLRIYETEKKVSKQQCKWYWNCVAEGNCSIRSSEQISKNYTSDLVWHTKHGYKVLPTQSIIKHVQHTITAYLK